jgi:hypothetical protein
MATTTLSAALIPKRIQQGAVQVTKTLTVAANPTANDVVELIRIPAYSTIHDLLVAATDMDSSTGMLFEIGDGADTDRFVSSSSIGQTGGFARMTNLAGAGYQYTAEDTIDIKFTAAASGTFTAGTVTVSVLYSADAAQS